MEQQAEEVVSVLLRLKFLSIMQYRILLKNLDNKEEAETTISADKTLEELCIQIKLALSLPYADYAWHRFQAFGITYMPKDTSYADEEMRSESGLSPLQYKDSEKVKLSQLFTILGSDILYTQERGGSGKPYRVRCILQERLE